MVGLEYHTHEPKAADIIERKAIVEVGFILIFNSSNLL
jgi:hypothetical protein